MISSVTFLRDIPVELPPTEGSSNASDSKLWTFCSSARLRALIWALGQRTVLPIFMYRNHSNHHREHTVIR
jgi:hypothetical protein